MSSLSAEECDALSTVDKAALLSTLRTDLPGVTASIESLCSPRNDPAATSPETWDLRLPVTVSDLPVRTLPSPATRIM